jgi:hypothetical protein
MSDDPKKEADLVVVLDPIYQGKTLMQFVGTTVLTLEMALHNARLLKKVRHHWLFQFADSTFGGNGMRDLGLEDDEFLQASFLVTITWAIVISS